MDWEQLQGRVTPAPADVTMGAPSVSVALLATVIVVAVPALWRVVRLGVTLVHELGHAVVGLAVGRRFTGFVLRGDMSGHAVTVGPARGVGRIVTTWAGYPAPAVVGAAMVWVAGRGWAAPVVTLALGVLVLAALRVRSALTALVMAVAIAAAGALWWWRDDAVQTHVLLVQGLGLVVGGWRHLGAVLRTRDRASDPAVLATLTWVPRVLWTASFVFVCAAATAVTVREIALAWQRARGSS